MHTIRTVTFHFMMLLIFISYSTFSFSATKVDDLNYDIYQNQTGDLFLRIPPQFILIAADISIPLNVTPKNGIFRLAYNRSTDKWALIILNETEFSRQSLSPTSEYKIEISELDGDGHLDLLIRSESSSQDSFIIKRLTQTAKLSVYSPSRNNIDFSQSITLTTKDLNGDNIDDLIALNNGVSVTYLGSHSGQLINTSASQTYANTGNIIQFNQGQFQVTDAGAANYTMPLTLPPATAGLSPDLGLIYNSQGGESILGVGWHLAGLSAINRCAKSIAIDGKISGVNFDENDAYCYNGQRLLLNTHSSNQYHTEIDTFNTFTAHPDKRNPQYFTLKTKTNETHYFGLAPVLTNASDAYIEPSRYTEGTLAQVWSLKAIIDKHGNYIRYDYNKNIAKGSHYLSRIIYGGNHLLGKPTYNSILFHYNNLDKSHVSFTNGSRLTHDKRLSSIQVKQDNDTYRSYKFTWLLGKLPEERRYVTAIQECFDQSFQICSPKTSFDFAHATHKSINPLYQKCNAATNGAVTCATVSYCEPGAEASAETWCHINYRTANFSPFETSSANINIHDDSRFNTQILDFNGDGYADMLFPKNNQWHYYTSNWEVNKIQSNLAPSRLSTQYLNQYPIQRTLNISTVGSKTQAISNASLGKKEHVKVMDIDGDGKQELLIPIENGHWHAISSDPSTGERRICETEPGTEHICFTTRVNYDFTYRSLGISSAEYANTLIADVNGDGLQDIVFKSGTNLYYYQNLGGHFSSAKSIVVNFPSKSGGAVLYQTYSQLSKLGKNTAMVDINADGLTDLIMTVKKTISNDPCGPFVTGYACPIAPTAEYNSQASTDYNTYAFIASFENNKITYTATNGTHLEKGLNNLSVADFNGDGLTDVTYQLRQIWYYRLSKGDGSFTFRKALTGINATNSSIYHRHQFIDLNNDGRTDVLAATANRNYDIYLASPSPHSEYIHFVKRGRLTTGTDTNPDITSIRFADVDGDTKVDLLYSSGNTNSWKLHKATRANINEHVITQITSSTGIKTDIAYATLGSGLPLLNIESSQKPDVKANYDYDDEPIGQEDGRDFLTPIAGMYLVSETAQQTNKNSATLTQYTYGGPLAHKKGRGFLGFETIQSTQPEQKLTSITQYHQLHPLTGQIKNQQQRYQNLTLKHTQHRYTRSVSAQGGIQVNPQQTQETHYHIDLSSNGTTPTHHQKVAETLTLNSFDNWNNLLSNRILKKSNTGQLIHESLTTHHYSNAAHNVITPQALILTHSHPQVASPSGQALDAKKFALINTTKVKKIRYQNTHDGQVSAQTRETNLSYYPNGLLRESRVNGLTSAFFYDKFGNKVAQQDYAKVDNIHYQKRANYWFYDSRGQYIASKMNSLGEKEHFLYNGTSGHIATQGRIVSQTSTGPNKLATTAFFDIVGRSIEQRLADGNYTKISRSYCAGCDKNYITETQTSSNQPAKISYLDPFGREREQKVKSFNGSWVVTSMYYNPQGLRTHISTPQFTSASSHYQQTFYDNLGRVYKKAIPTESSTVSRWTKINGLTTTRIDEKGQASYYTYSPDGLLVSLKNVAGQYIRYYYDAFNQQNKVTLTAKNHANINQTQVILSHFNDYGQLLTTQDPDKGSWAYTYNGFKEVIAQTDGENQVSLLGYDAIGRKIRQENNESLSCWYYSGNSHNKSAGKISSLKQWSKADTIPINCASTEPIKYSEQYHYDDFGRTQKINYVLDGTNYNIVYQYNSKGQLSRQYYPSNHGLFYVNFYYNAQHYLYLQKDNKGRALRKIIATDPYGNITEQHFGNGTQEVKGFNPKTGRLYTVNVKHGNQNIHQLSYGEYDQKGNLGSRSHSYYHQGLLNLAFNESFTYDNLNRLTNRQLSVGKGHLSPHGYSEQYQYDGFGNIKTRKGELNGNAQLTLANYEYQQSTSTNRLVNALVEGQHYSEFTYDNNGNILSDGTREFSYYSVNKIKKIQQGESNSLYHYTPDQNVMSRIDKRFRDGNLTIRNTHYVGQVYQKEQLILDDTIERTRHRYFINNIVIERDQFPSQATQEEVHYQHGDHQGSNLSITNQSGQVTKQYFYTAFGHAMEIEHNSLIHATKPIAQAYTDHETLPTLNIIQMGGRIYDPILSRFLQADPSIQSPQNLQNYNRFSYVLNNPLRYTDPSGYNFFEKVYKFLGKIDGREHSQKYVFQKNPTLANFTQTALTYIPVFGTLASAHFAFDRAYYASGSLRAAFKAGIITYVMAQVNGTPEFSTEAIALLAIDNINPDVGRVVRTLYYGMDQPDEIIGNLQHAFATKYAAKGVEKLAHKAGLSLTEFNALLTVNSFIGVKLTGTRARCDQDSCNIFGFTTREDGIKGIVGIIWDVNDTLLGYQGLMDAVGYNVVRQGYKKLGVCHSLGAITCNNLAAKGFTSTGELNALPFGNAAYGGAVTKLGTMDFINGFIGGFILNWNARSISCTKAPCHGFDDNYKEK
ncbi:toxin TcdB middle/N-terminal domain-containing protein [uncultured Shewanella sp.]|uniref:toxin TcdB middle/N-terminal domain-containing protein n=1 Tax=uncultured Shewanella sp. TaxID=173975 RepID=UPI002633414B|nr:toxin TcdB middle/N-terminal domain-containing protein [uncultured Shewanella sp.]